MEEVMASTREAKKSRSLWKVYGGFKARVSKYFLMVWTRREEGTDLRLKKDPIS